MSTEQNDEYLTSEVVIERKGKKRTFLVRESNYGLLQNISAALNHQDAEKKRQAMEAFGPNIIAATCSENGEPITFDQAKAFPASIGKRLEKEALHINGMDAESQAEAKNA
jgi:hypothetical protein